MGGNNLNKCNILLQSYIKVIVTLKIQDPTGENGYYAQERHLACTRLLFHTYKITQNTAGLLTGQIHPGTPMYTVSSSQKEPKPQSTTHKT